MTVDEGGGWMHVCVCQINQLNEGLYPEIKFHHLKQCHSCSNKPQNKKIWIIFCMPDEYISQPELCQALKKHFKATPESFPVTDNIPDII